MEKFHEPTQVRLGRSPRLSTAGILVDKENILNVFEKTIHPTQRDGKLSQLSE